MLIEAVSKGSFRQCSPCCIDCVSIAGTVAIKSVSLTINIASAKDQAGAAVTDFSTLADGRWDGEVAVQFTAVWKK